MCIYNKCIIFTGNGNSMQLEKKCDIIYNDLITILADHQNVIK